MIAERFLTPLQKYQRYHLENPVEVDEGQTMDLAKQIEIDFKPFLAPGCHLDGTDAELADLRRKLLAVDQAIGRYHEVEFILTCHTPPLVTWQTGLSGVGINAITKGSDVDQIKRSAIIDEIDMIMKGEQR